MEAKPQEQAENAPVQADAATATDHLFEQRASRSWFVNGLIVLALVAVAWSIWPTEPRKLERRAKDYLLAAFKGDTKAAYGFLAPASQERLRMDVWWTANRQRLASSEVVKAEVDASGDSAIVTLKDTRSKAERSTFWVRRGGTWYHDYDGK